MRSQAVGLEGAQHMAAQQPRAVEPIKVTETESASSLVAKGTTIKETTPPQRRCRPPTFQAIGLNGAQHNATKYWYGLQVWLFTAPHLCADVDLKHAFQATGLDGAQHMRAAAAGGDRHGDSTSQRLLRNGQHRLDGLHLRTKNQ